MQVYLVLQQLLLRLLTHLASGRCDLQYIQRLLLHSPFIIHLSSMAPVLCTPNLRFSSSRMVAKQRPRPVTLPL